MRIFNLGVYICPKMKVSIKSYTMAYQSKIKLHKKITWRRKNQTMWCDRYDSDNHFLHGHLIFFKCQYETRVNSLNLSMLQCRNVLIYLCIYKTQPRTDTRRRQCLPSRDDRPEVPDTAPTSAHPPSPRQRSAPGPRCHCVCTVPLDVAGWLLNRKPHLSGYQVQCSSSFLVQRQWL